MIWSSLVQSLLTLHRGKNWLKKKTLQMAQEGLKTSQMHQLTFQLTLLRYSDQDVILRYAIFRAVFITPIDFVCLLSTVINHRHIVWSACAMTYFCCSAAGWSYGRTWRCKKKHRWKSKLLSNLWWRRATTAGDWQKSWNIIHYLSREVNDWKQVNIKSTIMYN